MDVSVEDGEDQEELDATSQDQNAPPEETNST